MTKSDLPRATGQSHIHEVYLNVGGGGGEEGHIIYVCRKIAAHAKISPVSGGAFEL